jgi:septal ring factor EnvC (AmiA/AmiB activator)
MKDLLAQFESVERRLLEVLAERNDLRRQLAEAETERDQLRGQVRQQGDTIKKLQKKQDTLQNNFQKQHNIAKLVRLMTADNADTKETAELKGRIEAYIQEIDRCIAYLSQS